MMYTLLVLCGAAPRSPESGSDVNSPVDKPSPALLIMSSPALQINTRGVSSRMYRMVRAGKVTDETPNRKQDLYGACL